MAFRPEDDPYPLSLPMMDAPDMDPFRPSSTGTPNHSFVAPHPAPPLNDFDNFNVGTVFPNAVLIKPQGDYGSATQPAYSSAQISHSSESSPGSSSTSSIRHRRHVSSNSSRSATHENKPFVLNRAQIQNSSMENPNTHLDHPQKTAATSATDHDLDRQMNQLFDFDSAATSPGDAVTTEASSPKPIRGMAIPQSQRSSPPIRGKWIQPHNLAHSAASRSVVSTPSSFKPESSFQPPPSRNQPYEFRGPVTLQNEAMYNTAYGTCTGPPLGADAGFVSPSNFGYPTPMFIPPAATLRGPAQVGPLTGPSLSIEPISAKTRVETQIPIRMTLSPLPLGITKLHLPRRTMAKSKLIAKPPPCRAPDMLELDVMPVCASAMKNGAAYHRAFAMARGERISSQTSHHLHGSPSEGPASGSASTEHIEPMDGGPIQICDGCVMRERKRANRRIEKEETAEDIMWKQGEKDRIVVFNETEVVEWKAYGSADLNEPGGKRAKGGGKGKKGGEEGSTPTSAADPSMPYREQSKQVRLMMRITCYCRHQRESEGFRVILTLKDHVGNCVAQAISTAILITDDHKTSTLQSEGSSPTTTNGPPLHNGGSFFPPAPSIPARAASQLFNPAQSHSTTELSSHPFHRSHPHPHPALYRPATSVSLHSIGPTKAPRSTAISSPSNNPSYRTSATLTPRNLSRQVSPSAPTGPSPKRRKGSTNIPFHRPLVDLSMTRRWATGSRPSLSPSASSDASEGLQMALTGPTAPTASTASVAPPGSMAPITALTSSSTLGTVAGNNASDHPPESSPRQITPSSDSDPMVGTLSFSQSGTQSPPPDQHMPDIDMTAHAQADMAAHAQALHHSLLNVSGAVVPPHSTTPTVLRVIPSEGPISGGIDVTIIGQSFHNGLDVLFADAVATSTTVLNNQTIICTIPPSFQAGLVHVTLRGRHQPEPQVPFRYVNTDERDLMRLALSVFHHRNTGEFANPSDVARSIIGSQVPHNNQNPSYDTQYQQNSVASAMDLELSILGLIDLIDQAHTSIPPQYNLSQPNGQTMLHLSAALGYHRLAAGLLARGADPDCRDRNGMSAMHMACLHGHTNVVRKLLSAGGDPTLRSLLGLAPIDMATTQDVYQVVSSIERHTRSRSLGATPVSPLSRTSSQVSIRSFRASHMCGLRGRADLAMTTGVDDTYRSHPMTPVQVWARSRRNSAVKQRHFLSTERIENAVSNTHVVTAAAAMAAWGDNLAGQIHQFQQSVQRTLPNLQIPNLPPMPTFEAYQEHPMVRRISSLVPRITAPMAPPSYEEIYPESSQKDLKTASTARAVGDALIDSKCAMHFDATTVDPPSLMRAISAATTKEQQDKLRLAHARQVKGLSKDKRLFLYWIPGFVFLVLCWTSEWWVATAIDRVQQLLAA